MKATTRLLAAVLLCAGGPTARTAEADLPRMLVIETSTAAAPLGQRATLKVNPLKRSGDGFAGGYEITVAPLTFANESGSIRVTLPADALHKLQQREPISFTGSATNTSGKPRTVKGVATPKDARQGDITMEIHSERGTLHYATTYRLP